LEARDLNLECQEAFGVHELWLIKIVQYQELFALCQALPGPASTKMLFCIAMIHAGLVAAVFAFALWSLPGAIGMYGLSLGVQKMPERLPPIVYALLSGMNASTVGIIALAAVQLAEKAIKDRLTRILVIFGACAGLCYNALWYFPVLIVVGGITTVLWDSWLQQKVGKARARYEAKRRRVRNEAGDAEEITATQSIPLEEVARPEAVKRRPQAGSSADPILPEQEDSDAKRLQAAPIVGTASRSQSTPVVDTRTHNISVKVGLALIAGFFSKFSKHRSLHVLTQDSFFHHRHGNSRYR
jgi:chromate transport protein ChrA